MQYLFLPLRSKLISLPTEKWQPTRWKTEKDMINALQPDCLTILKSENFLLRSYCRVSFFFFLAFSKKQHTLSSWRGESEQYWLSWSNDKYCRYFLFCTSSDNKYERTLCLFWQAPIFFVTKRLHRWHTSRRLYASCGKAWAVEGGSQRLWDALIWFWGSLSTSWAEWTK